MSHEAVVLAPGREAWLSTYTFIQDSPSSMTTVAPRVTFESSDARIAAVEPGARGVARVVARAEGVAEITVRSQRDGNASQRVIVTVQPAPPANDSGLVYSAVARLVANGGSRDSNVVLGPTDLDVRVIVSNPTTLTRDVWLGGCSAWVRLYRTADHSGEPVLDIPRHIQCTAEGRHLTLAPFAADTLRAEAPGFTIASDTLANGRYHAVAVVDRVRDLLAVPAGTVDLVSPNAGLAFAATTSVSDAKLRVRATMTNTNRAPVRLEYGACAVTLLAYRTADLTGKAAWNSDYRRPYERPETGYGCPQYLATGVIQPGATLSPAELNPAFPVLEMLGDSLPGGRYYFRAEIRMNWRVTSVPAGDAVVNR